MSDSGAGNSAKEKGNAAFKLGDFPAAIGHYTSAILADPNNPTYPLNRAAAYLKLGKNEDAERDCSMVLKLDPKNVKAWFRRGQARAALGRLDDARDDFMRVLQLEPQNESAKQELSKLQAVKGKPDKKVLPADVRPPILGTAHTPPKRRRVPITIVDSTPSTSAASATLPPSTSTAVNDLMTPVSTRSIQSTASAAPPSAAKQTSTEAEPANPSAKSFGAPSPRPGGGIFRPGGKHTIFGAAKEKTPPSSLSAHPPPEPKSNEALKVTDVHAAAPIIEQRASRTKLKPPISLFNFLRAWDSLPTSEHRWQYLQQIPASTLPLMFQTSLEASTLILMVQTFRDVLEQSRTSSDAPHEESKVAVKDYMVNLARTPRFSTIVLFMTKDERKLVGDVWKMLDGTDAGERKAWGVS